jgi:hypothetical protein
MNTPFKLMILANGFIVLHALLIADYACAADDRDQSKSDASTKSIAPERVTVSWSKWTPMSVLEVAQLECFVNGASVGKGHAGVAELEQLKVKKGGVAKILVPPPKDGKLNTHLTPFICDTQFLQNLTEDGARVEFYDGETKLDWHTLYFRHMRATRAGHPEYFRYNADTAVFYVDGEVAHDGPTAVNALKKLKWSKSTVLVVLVPADYQNRDESLVEESQVGTYLKTLYDEVGVTRLVVGPSGFGYTGP